MRKFITSAALVISAIIGAGAAGAADLAARPYAKAALPMVAAIYGWSFGRSRTDVTIAGAPFAFTSQRMDGILGGLQAGYNWQSGGAVFGLETDIQATGQKGSSSIIDFIPGTA